MRQWRRTSRRKCSADQQLKNSSLNVRVQPGRCDFVWRSARRFGAAGGLQTCCANAGVKKVDDQMSTSRAAAGDTDSAACPPAADAGANAQAREGRSKIEAAREDGGVFGCKPADAGRARLRPRFSRLSAAPPNADAARDAAPSNNDATQPAESHAGCGGRCRRRRRLNRRMWRSPAGTTIRVRMIDPVNSAVNQTGEVFHASLEYPLVVNNETVVPKGADVYIRLDARELGRKHERPQRIASGIGEARLRGPLLRAGQQHVERGGRFTRKENRDCGGSRRGDRLRSSGRSPAAEKARRLVLGWAARAAAFISQHQRRAGEGAGRNGFGF